MRGARGGVEVEETGWEGRGEVWRWRKRDGRGEGRCGDGVHGMVMMMLRREREERNEYSIFVISSRKLKEFQFTKKNNYA